MSVCVFVPQDGFPSLLTKVHGLCPSFEAMSHIATLPQTLQCAGVTRLGCMSDPLLLPHHRKSHQPKHHPVLTFGAAELLCCSPTWRCTLALLNGLTTGPLPPSPPLPTAPGDPPAAAATLLPLLPPAAVAIAAAACRPETCCGCGAAASAERVVLPSLPPPAAIAAVSVACV